MGILRLTDNFRINKNQTKASRLANFCGRGNRRIYPAKLFHILSYQSEVLKCCNGSLVLFILFSSKPEVTCQRLVILLRVQCFTHLPWGKDPLERESRVQGGHPVVPLPLTDSTLTRPLSVTDSSRNSRGSFLFAKPNAVILKF